MDTYWNRKGKYQWVYDELWSKLVPVSGKAETIHGELLRNASRLYYDLFNNGFMNFEILQTHFDNMVISRNLLIGTGEITEEEFSDFENICGQWLENEEGVGYGYYEDDCEDLIYVQFDYDELIEIGLGDLLEKLASATIMYAEKKESE